MKYEYIPKGVCSRKMVFEINGDVIESLQVEGGCHGNLQGIARLVQGETLAKVVERLQGIKCGPKSTSCPDQIACALMQYMNANR